MKPILWLLWLTNGVMAGTITSLPIYKVIIWINPMPNFKTTLLLLLSVGLSIFFATLNVVVLKRIRR